MPGTCPEVAGGEGGVKFRVDRRIIGCDTLINEALLGVNFDKRRGLETATREPRTGDERQSTPAK